MALRSLLPRAFDPFTDFLLTISKPRQCLGICGEKRQHQNVPIHVLAIDAYLQRSSTHSRRRYSEIAIFLVNVEAIGIIRWVEKNFLETEAAISDLVDSGRRDRINRMEEGEKPPPE